MTAPQTGMAPGGLERHRLIAVVLAGIGERVAFARRCVANGNPDAARPALRVVRERLRGLRLSLTDAEQALAQALDALWRRALEPDDFAGLPAAHQLGFVDELRAGLDVLVSSDTASAASAEPVP